MWTKSYVTNFRGFCVPELVAKVSAGTLQRDECLEKHSASGHSVIDYAADVTLT